jgi:hypothetical protein
MLFVSFTIAWRYPNKEQDARLARDIFSRHLSPDYYVLANDWSLWSYYLRGKRDLFFPDTSFVDAFWKKNPPDYVLLKREDSAYKSFLESPHHHAYFLLDSCNGRHTHYKLFKRKAKH